MANNLYNSMYNPDVLSCIANLSNDEVFTPPDVANAMLDLLPQELFSNPDTTFLDPACKSGVFLREIAKRLLKGLEPIYPDLEERTDHIFKKQLFGIAITELTSHLSRRSLYCSKTANGNYSVVNFDTVDGNIRFKNIQHRWKDGRCMFCGASKLQYDRAEGLETHAYEMIHTTRPEDIFKMKFDVIIGNPPYQLNDGGGSNGISAKPIYNLFVEQSKRLKPRYLSMIIPSRWFAGGKGLNEFRERSLQDKHITHIIHYPKSRECFQGVDIAGGVHYFLWERDKQSDCEFTTSVGDEKQTRLRNLNEFPVLISDNVGIDIIHKVKAIANEYVSSTVLTRNSFGFTTSARGSDKPFTNSIKLISSGGISYVNRNEVTKNADLIDKYKISVGTLNPDRAGVNNAADGKMNVTTKTRILQPNEVVTETYIVVDTFVTPKEADNFAAYMCTKFARFMISLTISSMHIVRDNFAFVPKMDNSIKWTDELLNKHFNLSNDEIAYIDSKIREMSMDGGDD